MAPAEIASKINWDKAITSDEREVCHTQAALFEFCQNKLNCDAFDFITNFMQGEVAADIDNNGPAYYDVNPFEFIDSVRDKVPMRPISEKKYTEALHWIGYLYRYWAWLGLPSKDIIQAVPVNDAYDAHYSLHTLDVRDAIKLFVERWV